MARPGLFAHRKFRKLSRLLKSDALAVGHLELMWHAAYEDGEARLGGPDEVESAARWRGQKGKLLAAFLDSGFIDDLGGGTYGVHDLFEHAPAYVRKRQAREAQRRATDQSVTSQRLDSDSPLSTTPAPCSQHPAPAPSTRTLHKEKDTPQPPSRSRAPVSVPIGFQAAWDDYPHHEQRSVKSASLAVWTKHKLEEQVESVRAWIKAGKSSDDWTREGGRYVKGMQVWLKRDFTEMPTSTADDPLRHLSPAGRSTAEAAMRWMERTREGDTR